jgi:hypothetical protein
MFVGHYGPSFLAKRAERANPLWVLFIAVQSLDVLLGDMGRARGRGRLFALAAGPSRPPTGLGLYDNTDKVGLGLWDHRPRWRSGPPPSLDSAMAVTALVAYALLAGAIPWLEKGGVSEEWERDE